MGERALFQALRSLKARGATVITVSHRMNILAEVDALLLMAEGTLKAFGPRDQVLAELARANQGQQPKQAKKPPASSPEGQESVKKSVSKKPLDGEKSEGEG